MLYRFHFQYGNRTSSCFARSSTPWVVLVAGLLLVTLAQPAAAQETVKANYKLAARFAPYKIQKLIYSTTVSPRWIEGGEKFWYEWKTSEGTFYYRVDPVQGTKSQIFDNDRIAAELTRITKDPWDGQHLPIRSIKFIDENTLQFEVESSQDAEIEEEEEDTDDEEQEEETSDRKKTKKKVFHFEYDVRTQTLRELEDFEEPDDHPSWASVSPDGETVIFARNHNLFKMSGEDYKKILDARRGKDGDDADKADQKVEVEEIALTTDGEKHYSYANRDLGDTDDEVEKNKDKRKRASVTWSHDSNRFSITRRDQREVGDLWVIHSVGNKRPQLETYRYDMPGEDDVTQFEIFVYDLADSTGVTVQAEGFKDQSLSTYSARRFIYPDSDEPRYTLWLSEDPNKI